MSVSVYSSSRVVLPEGIRPAAIFVDNQSGRIIRISEDPEDVDAHREPWHWVPLAILPGLIDTHVHINEPGRTDWEGFETATRAAAAGGFTTVVDMPLNCLPPTTSVAGLEAKRASAAGKCTVDWLSWGGAENGNQAHLVPLAEAGVPGFKCFLVYPGCDGLGLLDEANLRAAMPVIAATGLPLLVHAELPEPLAAAAATLAGADWRSYKTYLASRPDESELAAIRLLIELCREFRTRIHIVHLATALALPMLREAKAEGLPITVETCPHYLHFSAEGIPDGATQYKCAPPLRSAANRELLWEGIADETIDMIASDHSPCPPAMKGLDTGRFDTSWGGIASLSLSSSVVWSDMHDRGLDLTELAWCMSTNPARLAGLEHRKGRIAVGYDADLVFFDAETRYTVTEKDLVFRHPVSPYVGLQLTGRVQRTMLRGQTIFDRGSGSDFDQFRGREIPATQPDPPAETYPSFEPGYFRQAAEHTLDLCARIAACTDVPGTITRTFLSPATRAVHTLLRAEMEALGMIVRTDAAGNLRGIYAAAKTDAPVLLIGSHIDTVPNGGAYDGILGVALPLALLRSLHGEQLPYAIEIIAFSEEEGVRFKLPFIGSRALVGTLGADDLARTDANGISIAQAILNFSGAPSQTASPFERGSLTPNTFAFFEVHIEQGPLLESYERALGVVTGIVGQSRLGVTFHGEANHAGTTPMSFRKDALVAAADWIAAVAAYPAEAEYDLLATVGFIQALPGAGNVIPGTVTASLDVRHYWDHARLRSVDELKKRAEACGQLQNVTVTFEDRGSHSYVTMHPHLVDLLAAAWSGRVPRMPSGAGHDAMILAPHLPTAMLFVRTPRGLSHHPEESVSLEDVEAALATCRRFLHLLDPAQL